MIHLDFESRSKVDIWTAGAWSYAVHPSTELLCLAYRFDDGPIKVIRYEELAGLPILSLSDEHDELFDRIRKGELVGAYNAFFEQVMWLNICVPKYSWPHIPIRQWRCTMAKALSYALPRALGECGKVLNIDNPKNESGKRVMLSLAKPKSDGTFEDDPEKFEKLYEYCADDVLAESEIDSKLKDLIPTEQVIWFLDQLINQRGVYVDRWAVDCALRFIEKETELLLTEVGEVSGGYLNGVSRRQRVMTWIKEQGVDINGYTKQDVNEVLLREDVPEEVRRVLEIKLSAGKTSLKKYDAIASSVGDDGRIRDIFIYHGASTGRWAGKLIQLQNLPKGNVKDTDQCVEILKMNDFALFKDLYPDVLGTLSACIRGMICAEPGNDLLVADYAAIEARVVMWLAGEKEGLQKFANGEDLYVDMARVIYSKTDISKSERQLGKTAILGCGYGMGAVKFHATCNSWGIPISEDLAQKAVNAYRETYSSVKNFWYAQESAAVEAVQRSGQVIDCGPVRWYIEDNFLFCQLPSGRRLAYNQPRVDKVRTQWGLKSQLFVWGVNSTTKKWEEQTTYGGKIVENITQAVARDILAAAMLRCEKARYKVVFSVHDEIVAEVPEDFGTLEEFIKLLTTLPVWAKGCPISAEGWRGGRYKK